MPTATATAQVTAAAEHRLNLRAPTADEVRLIAEAVDAGARVRSDSAWEDFLNGGALPLTWGTYVHCEDYGDPYYEQPAADAAKRRDVFYARMQSGDLKALAYRVIAQRAALVGAASVEAA
jgi:hypothetical protein